MNVWDTSKEVCEQCGKSLIVGYTDDGVPMGQAVAWNPSGIHIYEEGRGYVTELHRFCSYECRDKWVAIWEKQGA